MMKDLHILMSEGPLTPKQSMEVAEMMLQLSRMMREMSGPQGESLASRHEQGLKAMRRRVKEIRAMMKTH